MTDLQPTPKAPARTKGDLLVYARSKGEKMKRLIIAFLLIGTLTAIGQAPKAPTPPSAKPPAITDAQRAQFFKAQSQMIQANAQAQQRQAEFQSAIAEIQKTCGDTASLTLNQYGDLECVAKPAPAKTPEPTKGTK
jgi:hypothetical protein